MNRRKLIKLGMKKIAARYDDFESEFGVKIPDKVKAQHSDFSIGVHDDAIGETVFSPVGPEKAKKYRKYLKGISKDKVPVGLTPFGDTFVADKQGNLQLYKHDRISGEDPLADVNLDSIEPTEWAKKIRND